MIETRLDAILAERRKSLYWLQQQTGLAYTTLFKIRHGQANSITFKIMNDICRVLDCQPGDLFVYAKNGLLRKPKERPVRSAAKKMGPGRPRSTGSKN
ncbi:MAG TPA: helix-turn-helix domain-containing protein [Blastocatellia bacterium]|nr:helix-turn-helix domain-containing protein [Blastocatellia bacterium]